MNKDLQQTTQPDMVGVLVRVHCAYHNLLFCNGLWKKRSNLDSVKEAYNSVDQRIAVIVSRHSRRGRLEG